MMIRGSLIRSFEKLARESVKNKKINFPTYPEEQVIESKATAQQLRTSYGMTNLHIIIQKPISCCCFPFYTCRWW